MDDLRRNGDARVGVYVCHCGVNISATVDVVAVREYAARCPGVVRARDYPFMCSNAGQDLIKQDIRENGVNRVVIAACSPLMHELTFRGAGREAGLNPYLVQIANIREQCAWVHPDRARGTEKAKATARAAINRVARHMPLEPMHAAVNPATLIVGGGIAGLQAAIEIADSGNHVYVVERDSTIGGKMAQFDKTFPTLDCAACILTPKMVSAGRNPNIHLMTLGEVESVEGFVGNFKVRVRQKARYVTSACTSCGECVRVCPVNVVDPFNTGQSSRTAIHKAFPQAVPGTYVIEKHADPPCMQACPIHQHAAGYVALVAEGRFEEAARLIRRSNPLPFICGRVCYHPCENACSRRKVDEPVSIRNLKRFVMDWEREHIGEVLPPPPEQDYRENVAVVGSGPAGLTAAFDLVSRGYKVTVFERHPRLGGMLAVGLPEYRCPREIVERDLRYLRKLGVRMRTGVELGRDFTLETLFSEAPEFGFKAVFLGLGAHEGLPLNVDGEDLDGVLSGVEYLKRVNLGLPLRRGRWVAVVGGGNTAMDAARTARREGAEVTVLYRRTRAEMPVEEDEYADAVREGVRFEYLIAPVRINGEGGRVRGVRCVRMKLGRPDPTGRPRPVPIGGSEHDREFDMIILSISQKPERTWFGGAVHDATTNGGTGRRAHTRFGDFKLTKWDTIQVDPESLQTDVPGVFAGGDLVAGPATIVEAMGQGRRAAEAIHRYLRAIPLEGFATHMPPAQPDAGFEARPHPRAPAYDRIPHAAREAMPKRTGQDRRGDFAEVDLGFSEEQARAEARRCLHCGVCVSCHSCEEACPPGAVVLGMTGTLTELEVGQILVSTGYQLFDASRMGQYGYGRLDNVLSSLDFERMLSSTGPTGGKIVCKSGRPPRAIGIVHCIGSRDQRHHRYCSRVCCMYALKFAHLVRERTGAEVYEFYIDMRCFGKGYEEFYTHVLDEGATVIRGKVAEVAPVRNRVGENDGHLLVRCEDTLIGRFREIPVDMVVLCNAIEAQADAGDVGRRFSLNRSADGFFLERHPKLDPVGTTTDGVYIAGCCQGPKDIPDTVAQSQAAAARILSVIGRGEVLIDPVRASVDSTHCGGCMTCVDLCPYRAITFDHEKKLAIINEALCKGCGTCVAACPAAAISGAGFTDEQVLSELEGLLIQTG